VLKKKIELLLFDIVSSQGLVSFIQESSCCWHLVIPCFHRIKAEPRPQHKIACKVIVTSIKLEEIVMRLCQSPVILNLLRVAIAQEHDFTTLSPASPKDLEDHECYLVFVHLHVHPASQEDFRAISSVTRNVQTKGPDSQIPGFVVLQIGSDVRKSMTVPITVKPIPLGEYRFEFDGWEQLMNTKDKEAYERRRMRYAKLYKQARDNVQKRGQQTPDPVVMVQFEYDESTYNIGLNIMPDALESAGAFKLPAEYENILNACGVSVPESEGWIVRDIEKYATFRCTNYSVELILIDITA
jgi:hypothetical protein